MKIDAGARPFLAAALGLILLGAGLRLAGSFGGIELWMDEAGWVRLLEGGGRGGLRPVGYAWLSRWLIDLRNTEPVIRAPSLLAGLLSLPVFVAMCRRAGLSRLASLFGLFILAVHPAAVDLAKEFKPYALELFLHLLLLWLAFSFLKTRQTRWLVGTCLVAVISPLFSWSIVVLYPGLFVAVAVVSFRPRRWPQLLGVLGAGAAALGVSLGGYLAEHRGRAPNAAYWGSKYDVFYLESDLHGHLEWLLEKTYDIAAYASRLQTFWLDPSVVEVFGVLSAALCLAGVGVVVVARRWGWAALWLSPWVVTIGLNLVGKWPYGVFRTNLYLLAYSLPLALAGLDALRPEASEAGRETRRWRRLIVPALGGVFVLAFLPLDVGHFATGKASGMTSTCQVRQAMEVIYQAEGDTPPPDRKRPLLLNSYAWGPYQYYRNFHVESRQRYRTFFRDRYWKCCKGMTVKESIEAYSHRGFWMFVCKPSSAAAARRQALERCPEVESLHDFRHGGVLVRCRGRAEPPRGSTAP